MAELFEGDVVECGVNVAVVVEEQEMGWLWDELEVGEARDLDGVALERFEIEDVVDASGEPEAISAFAAFE